jgi:predicted acylesterase/phospholipase RssA
MIRSNGVVNALRGFGSFYHASFRLLEDIVDDSPEWQLHPYSLKSLVEKARAKSFSLYWSLDIAHWPHFLRNGPPLHLIWLCERAGMGAPLETLAHILARSIARQHTEPAAVATVAGDAVYLVAWDPGGKQRKLGRVRAKKDAKLIEKRLGIDGPDGKRPFCHLIVIRPPDGRIPEGLRKSFHRIVAVTDDTDVRNLPAKIGKIGDVLTDAVFKDSAPLPHYCALIPTVIVPPETGAPKARSEEERMWRAAAALYGSGPFETRTIAAGSSDPPERDGYWRLSRDTCRLPLDLDAVAEHPDVTSSPELDLVGERWARAVTNRQVGLALSGGGACLYRLVPLIYELLDRDIPIDVVGGVSGGAILGAYFCARGREGIEQAIDEGPNINWYGLAAMVDSRALQFKIDFDLDAARIEDLPTRFIAITTALYDDRRPQGQAVVRGTVGEAVRVSGSAPIQFGRTIKGTTRYTDGANAVMIPARALRDYGADFVFACNAIPGPATGNPFAGLSAAWRPLEKATSFLIRYTELGRFIDAWISTAFLIEQASREVEEDASEYAEVSVAPAPLSDGIRFWAARELAAAPPKPTKARETSRKGRDVTAPPADTPSPMHDAEGLPADGIFQKRWKCVRKSPRLTEKERLAKEPVQKNRSSRQRNRTSQKKRSSRQKTGSSRNR